MKGIKLQNVEITSDNVSAVTAVSQPREWPRFRNLLDKITQIMDTIAVCEIKLVKITANSIARAIAKSVTKEGRFQSYMALGGPV